MFIDQLLITDSSGHEVRKITFNPSGLNLVVGMNEQKGSTNNIGKTTLIRCIDFCLNGRLEQIYTDKEFKDSINEDIFNFFKVKQPTFTATFKDGKTDAVYTITRTLAYDKEKFTFANKILLNNSVIEGDFETELKKIFFNNLENKPTFRQLVPKFIRKDEQQVSNVLKFLHITTPYTEYEKVHLFLFGFNAKKLLQEKSELEHEIKRKKKSKEALGSRFNVTDLKQILKITKKDLENLYQQRDSFQLDEKYELEEQELKQIQLSLIKLEKKISDLQLQKAISINKQKELQEGIFVNDTQALKLIYDEASFYANNLHKSFDDVVNFHNKMIQNEMDYLTQKIATYEGELKELHKQRNILSDKYSVLLKKLAKTGSLAEYTKLNEQIEKLAEKKGQNEKLLYELATLENEISQAENKLTQLKSELAKNLADFDNKLSIFNDSFSTYSKLLYDKEYFVSYDPNDEPIKFYTKNVGGNDGSGKKQAVVSAFDLAYIDFINKLKLNFPHFVAHDKVELIDIEKLEALFDISNTINGQFIVPVIYDKIEDIYDKYKKDHIILELSDSNKFFNV